MSTVDNNNKSLFTFVLIPSDAAKSIQEIQLSKEGGLENDELVKYAKNYFYNITGAKNRVEQIKQANITERQIIVSQIRQQLQDQVKDLNDDEVIERIYQSQIQQQQNCDIIALTVPTSKNNYMACSMYIADDGQKYGLHKNERAITLITACGHNNKTIVYGDVFIGRAYDDERTEWVRMNFTIADADPSAEWCQIARQINGGGGSGSSSSTSSSPSSLSKLIQQQMNTGNTQVIDTNANNETSSKDNNNYGMNGSKPVEEEWGSWIQTDEEIELKFIIEKFIKTKDIQIKFTKNTISIIILKENIKVVGTTFDPIIPDECTYTIQDIKNNINKRELCVTLTKAQPGRIWVYIVK